MRMQSYAKILKNFINVHQNENFTPPVTVARGMG